MLVVTLVALLLGSAAGAAPSARSTTVRVADTKSWCAAVIATNTKYGVMKNKTFIPIDKVSPTAWKNVVDAAVAGRSRFIALAPASIKTAVSARDGLLRPPEGESLRPVDTAGPMDGG